jgi:hypothetical protein
MAQHAKQQPGNPSPTKGAPSCLQLNCGRHQRPLSRQCSIAIAGALERVGHDADQYGYEIEISDRCVWIANSNVQANIRSDLSNHSGYT